MPDIVEFTRFYLAIFYSLVAAFYTARIVLMKRSTSKELVFPGERYCVTWWNHIAFRFFRVAIWGICLARLFYPGIDNYLGIINSLETPLIILSGIFLLTIGFVSTVAIHYQHGAEWRSGIDPQGPQKLITRGFYKYSRNPMFLFVAAAQLGFFLALPSFFSLVCLFFGLYTLARQAKAEEEHLLHKFPNEYASYSQKVARWI